MLKIESQCQLFFPPGFATPQTFLWYFWNETTFKLKYEIQKPKMSDIFFPTSKLEPRANERTP